MNIITPAHRADEPVLAHAGLSLNHLVKAGMNVTWWLVDDRPMEQRARPLFELLAYRRQTLDVEGRYLETPRNWGQACARNLALHEIARERGDGALVGTMDEDDMLGAGYPAVVRQARCYLWAAGFGVDVDAYGRVLGAPAYAGPRGVLKPGELGRHGDEIGVWPLLCNATVSRAGVLVSVGGWSALYRDEDTSMWRRVTDRHAGRVLEDRHEPAYLWRQHEAQTSRQDWWNSQAMAGVRRAR